MSKRSPYLLTEDEIGHIVAALRDQATHGFGDPNGRHFSESLADFLEIPTNEPPEGND